MDEDSLPPPDFSAAIARALIWEVNVFYTGFTAEMLQSLVEYVTKDLGPGILRHPQFPSAAVNAWAAHNGIDLRLYAKAKKAPTGN